LKEFAMPMHIPAICLAATIASCALLHGERAVQSLLPQPGRTYKIEARFGEPAARAWDIIARLNQAHDRLIVVARRQGDGDRRDRRVSLLHGHLVVTVAS
jgi:hypothetical protein